MIRRLRVPLRAVRATVLGWMGEWFFALFLFAGFYKMDTRLGFIQNRVDITLLFLILSFLVFLYQFSRKSLAQKMPKGFVKAALFLLLLDACLLVGLFISHNKGYGLDKTVKFIILTGWAFFGAGLLIPDFISLRRFSWAIVTISTISALDAIGNYPGIGEIRFVTALGSNYIALARAGGLGLLAIISFLLPKERSILKKLFLWVMAGLQLFSALSAGARGPVLNLFLSLLVLLALSTRFLPRLKLDLLAWRIGVIALIIAIVIIILGQNLFSTLTIRMRILMTVLGDSAISRLDLYREAIRLWTNSPIWGGGPGHLGIAVQGEDVRLYPHNIVLELGAETGLIGVLLFGSAICIAFSTGFAGLRSSAGDARLTARYLLIAGLFTLLNAMVSGDINDNRLLFTMVGLLSCAPRFQTNVGVRGIVTKARHSFYSARLYVSKEPK
ncbi:MAG: O-antigen ligase family protein [Candidatus Saccharicenans sp.]